MALARYEPSDRGFKEMAMSPDILDACLAEAEKGKGFAVAISPRSGDEHGRPYADSFDVDAAITNLFRGGPRVMAVLSNDAPHAAAVEFGNQRTPQPHRILGRTAAFLGGP